jgi:D-mannonate dehydratase
MEEGNGEEKIQSLVDFLIKEIVTVCFSSKVKLAIKP